MQMVDFAIPMSPIYSLISFIEYLSMYEAMLSYLKLYTILRLPSFFGTQTTGLLLDNWDLWIRFKHSVTFSFRNGLWA
jgi:hypothetical protein